MSETIDTQTTTTTTIVSGTPPEGKGLAIGGFVLSLVTLVLSSWICALAVAAMILGGSGWLMYLWLVLAALSVVLSVMGMSKLKKTGGKRGLGIAGMVIGIVSTVWCIILVLGMSLAMEAARSTGTDFDDLRQQMEEMQNH